MRTEMISGLRAPRMWLGLLGTLSVALAFAMYGRFEAENVHVVLHSEVGSILVPLWKANAYYVLSVAAACAAAGLAAPRFTATHIVAAATGIVAGFVHYAGMFDHLPLSLDERSNLVYASVIGYIVVVAWIFLLRSVAKWWSVCPSWIRYLMAALLLCLPYLWLSNLLFWTP